MLQCTNQHFCSIHAQAQDKKDLEEIRNDFISDGLRWSSDSDKKLVHLWRKLKRTEQAVRAQSHKVT